jgi:glycosyltransferase involved in cell wall biosynthesis
LRPAVLYLVPLAPPVTGATVASERSIHAIHNEGDAVVLPYQRGTLGSGGFTFSQALRILSVGVRLVYERLRKGRQLTAVYLVVSSTFWGNIRDLFLVALLGRRLRSALVLHIHNATIGHYFARTPIPLRRLNAFLLGQARSAIVLAPSLKGIVEPVIPTNKVRVIPNFFDSELLLSDKEVLAKFQQHDVIQVLYLSNLMMEKGYLLLLDAFNALPNLIRSHAQIRFAGDFQSKAEKRHFLERIAGAVNIRYEGVATGEKKKNLFRSSHVFCLPTFYEFETQPISVLEAYASGCVVLTSDYGPLGDIFVDQVNGLRLNRLAERAIDAGSLARALALCVGQPERFLPMARHNRKHAAENYSVDAYDRAIRHELMGAGATNFASE